MAKPRGWKRLIEGCDGTWNRPETLDPTKHVPTNVLKILRAVRSVDTPPAAVDTPSTPVVQAMEYVRGIGTGNLVDHVVGGATGAGISANIEQAYHFIANNYQPGDDIYVFGFSRGAFTARSLSGFLHHLGILRKDQLHRFPEAYFAYQTTPTIELRRLGEEFGSTEQTPGDVSVPIEFLGVWDTVGALGGMPIVTDPWVKFHDADLAPNVTHAYHALAAHEFRLDFVPTLWTTMRKGQRVEQVWFCGAHSDVGGGGDHDGVSNTTLQWMINRAREIGLAFDEAVVGSFTADVNAPLELSYTKWYWLKDPEVRTFSGNGVNQFKHSSIGERTSPTVPASRFFHVHDDLFKKADREVSQLDLAPSVKRDLLARKAQQQHERDVADQKASDARLASLPKITTRLPSTKPRI